MFQLGRGRRLLPAGAIALALAGIGGGGVADASVAHGSQTVYLNSQESASHDIPLAQCESQGGCGSTATAPSALTVGTQYQLQVSGTVSVWDDWGWKRCGKPEPNPEFASPGVTSTPTGDDVVFRFATAVKSGQCPKPLYRKNDDFQVNTGSGWFTPTAVGNPVKPSKDTEGLQHPYTFVVTGDGVPPEFRWVDYIPSDNDGEFQIVISSASAPVN